MYPPAALSDAVFSAPVRVVGGPAPLAPAPPRPDPKTRKVRPDLEYLAGGDRWGTLGGYLRSLPPWIDSLTFEFGPDLYDRMQLDGQVSSSLRALVHSVLSDDLTLRPGVDDADDPDFGAAKQVLGFMGRATWEGRGGTDEWLYAMARGALGGGNRVSETVLRVEESGRDAGKMVLDRLAVKPRRSFAFVVDQFNRLAGIGGVIPGQYGSAAPYGTTFSPETPPPNLLPREKFCVASWDPPDGDPRGSAILRCVYEPWWAKLQAARDWLANLAQFGSPSLVGKTAPGADSSAATDGYGNPTPDGVVLTPEQDFLNQILAFRNGSGIVIPAGAELDALTVPNAGKAFAEKVDASDRAIAQGILLAMRAVMQSRFGSRADAEQGQDVAGLQARFVKRWLARMVTEDLLRYVYRVNYGPNADPRLCPYASLSPVEHQDLGASLVAVSGAWKNGLIKNSQLPWVYEQFGMPPATEEELKPAPPPGAVGQGGPPAGPPDGKPQPPQAPFSTDQPHIPAGSPEGGEWTSGGGGTTELPGRLADMVDSARPSRPFHATAFHGSPHPGLREASATPLDRQFDNGTSQLGAFFAPAVPGAAKYAGASGRVYRAELHLKNPYEMPARVFLYLQDPTKDAEGLPLPPSAWDGRLAELRREGRDLRHLLLGRGHDGVIVRGKGNAVEEVASFHNIPLGSGVPVSGTAPFAYDPGQPRVPAGSPEGGEFGAGTGGAGATVARKKRLARKAQDAAFRAAYEAQQAYRAALALIPADVPALSGLVKTALRHLSTEAYGAAVDARRPILSAMYRAGTHGRLPAEAVHQLHVAGAYGADARKLAQKAERLFVSAYRQKWRGKGRPPPGAAPFAWEDQPRVPAGSPEGGEWGSGGHAGGLAPVPAAKLARYLRTLQAYVSANGPAPASELAGHLTDAHRLGPAKARAVVGYLAADGSLAQSTDQYGRAVLGKPGAKTSAPGPAPQATAAASPEAYVLDFAARAGDYPGGLAPVWELRRQLGLPPDDFKDLLFRLRREGKIRLVAVGDQSRLTHEQLRDSVQGENERFAYVEPGPDHPTAPFAFDPGQPRVPAGSPGGGEWGSGGGGGGAVRAPDFNAAWDDAQGAHPRGVAALAGMKVPSTAAEAKMVARALRKAVVDQWGKTKHRCRDAVAVLKTLYPGAEVHEGHVADHDEYGGFHYVGKAGVFFIDVTADQFGLPKINVFTQGDRDAGRAHEYAGFRPSPAKLPPAAGVALKVVDFVAGDAKTRAALAAPASAPFALAGPDLSGLGDLLSLTRQEVLDALFDAAIDSFDLALPDASFDGPADFVLETRTEGSAPFGGPDQPRVPAGQAGGGEWTSGGGGHATGEEIEGRSKDLRTSGVVAADPVRSDAHVAALAGRMREDGWVGRPLLVVSDGDTWQAWTGSHRLAAASIAGLDTVPAVVVKQADVSEAAAAEGHDPDVHPSDLDDEAKAALLSRLNDPVVNELMRQEIAQGGAAFYSPDQPRDELGRWTTGGGAGAVGAGGASRTPAEHAANREAASDAVRAFAAGQGPPTAAEAEALAGHLARLTVAQIHALKAEHGLRGSAPNKAALVAKMAERFRAHRERNFPESLSTGVDKGTPGGHNAPVGETTPTGASNMTTETQAGAVKDDNGVLSFEWRPATGPFAGQTLTGGYQATHPQAGRGLSFTRHGNEAAFKAAKVKDAKVFVKAEGKPDVQELLAEYDRKDAERQAEYDRRRQAAKQADAALVADMKRKADELRAQIPAGNVPVVLREKFRDSDGDPYYSYEADGVTLEGTEKDLMVHHGSAHAIRPGAMNSFASEHVYLIPRADLERVRAAQQARRTEKERKDAARKAEAETRRRNAFAEAKAIGKPVVIRTWSESVDDPENENSLDIVSELAMPDGTTTTRRSPTH